MVVERSIITVEWASNCGRIAVVTAAFSAPPTECEHTLESFCRKLRSEMAWGRGVWKLETSGVDHGVRPVGTGPPKYVALISMTLSKSVLVVRICAHGTVVKCNNCLFICVRHTGKSKPLSKATGHIHPESKLSKV